MPGRRPQVDSFQASRNANTLTVRIAGAESGSTR